MISVLSRRTLLRLAGLATTGISAPLITRRCETGVVDVRSYGAGVGHSPAHNLAAFRAAIAATPEGGTLLIPGGRAGVYAIDTSGGLEHALVIDRAMSIVLDGRIRATHGQSGHNPPYIFDVHAADVRFAGNGTISGPGASDDTNNLDDLSHAGLIRVTGDRFRFEGITVSDVPKIGIHLWNCRGATISARWIGGVLDYKDGHTSLFGIRATGGGEHRIISNQFERDDQGRRLITGYFAGGLMGATEGDEISGNLADVHEKLAYLYTNFSRVQDCHVVNAQQTDILRIVGSYNQVNNITGDGVKGGVSVYNGIHNKITNCVFKNVQQAGIFISFMADYHGGYVGTVISGNTIIAAADAVQLQDGICLYLADEGTAGVIVTGNRVEAAGPSSWRNGVRVEVIPPYFGSNVIVANNIIDGAVNGISVRRLGSGDLSGNKASNLRGGEAILRITS